MPSIEKVYAQIVQLARLSGAARVVLFGSRARGDNLPKSDIDIAVSGCDDFDAFSDSIAHDLDSLLGVDIIDLDSGISTELRSEIERDGVTLYEEE